MDISFARAILISAVFHVLLIVPVSRAPFFDHLKPHDRSITVDYITVKESPRASQTKVVSTPAVTVRPDIQMQRNEAKPQEGAKKPAAPAVRTTVPDALKAVAVREAKIKSTRDYVNYYSLIRERIRQHLKYNYRYYSKEGEIHISFVLGADGTLLSNTVDEARSTNDPVLVSFALKSLGEASPFPRFPKALAVPRMSFNLLVSFKKQ